MIYVLTKWRRLLIRTREGQLRKKSCWTWSFLPSQFPWTCLFSFPQSGIYSHFTHKCSNDSHQTECNSLHFLPAAPWKWILPGELAVLVMMLPVSPWTVFSTLQVLHPMPPALGFSPHSDHKSWASEWTISLCSHSENLLTTFAHTRTGLLLWVVSLKSLYPWLMAGTRKPLSSLPQMQTVFRDCTCGVSCFLSNWYHSCLLNYVIIIPLFYTNWTPTLWNTLLP